MRGATLAGDSFGVLRRVDAVGNDFALDPGLGTCGKLGQAVAEPIVTLIDDATVPNHRGSFRVDDEGTPAQATELVVDGVLRAYQTDRRRAGLLGLPRSGNGRRQSFQHLVGT